MRHSVPSHPVAIVSCHLEQPLRDDVWARFDELQQRRPGGFDVIALMRPPDAAYGEDVERWLTRARAASRRGPFGLHTHWTSPTHARPSGGDPAERVHREAEWMRSQQLEPHRCRECQDQGIAIADDPRFHKRLEVLIPRTLEVSS